MHHQMLVSLATEGPAAVHAATGLTAWGWLLVALPLAGAALLLLGGRATDSFGPILATVLSWAKVTKTRFAALSMSSTPMKTTSALRRSSTVAPPIAKSTDARWM